MKSILLLLLLFCLFSRTAVADEITIATGHTFIKRVFEPIRQPLKEKTGLELKIIYRDPIPALAELVEGNVDFAGASMPVETWFELAQKSGILLKDKSLYSSLVVIHEKAHFVVNSSNIVKLLSKEQLKGIFTGKIVNWKEVGGEDIPIVIIWPTVSSGAILLVKEKILNNEPVSKTVYDIETIGDAFDAVASTPEGIGIITGGKKDSAIKEIAEPMERPLTLIYKEKPAPKLERLLDYLKNEGKAYFQ